MDFEPVNIEDLPESTRGRNGSNSNELVDSFLASPHTTVKVNTGLDGAEGEKLDTAKKRTASIRSSAGTYIERLELPVRLFTRGGAIYLHKDDSMPAQHAENKRQREIARKQKAEAKAQEEANQPTVESNEGETQSDDDWAPEDSALANA